MVANAEGLWILTQHTMHVQTCDQDEALRLLYQEFKQWCKQNKLHCTQRRWTSKHLHLCTREGVKDFPSFKAKAFNARVILAWLADPHLKDQMDNMFLDVFDVVVLVLSLVLEYPKNFHRPILGVQKKIILGTHIRPSCPQETLTSFMNELLRPRPGEAQDAASNRVQLWSLGIAAVFPDFIRNILNNSLARSHFF